MLWLERGEWGDVGWCGRLDFDRNKVFKVGIGLMKVGMGKVWCLGKFNLVDALLLRASRRSFVFSSSVFLQPWFWGAPCPKTHETLFSGAVYSKCYRRTNYSKWRNTDHTHTAIHFQSPFTYDFNSLFNILINTLIVITSLLVNQRECDFHYTTLVRVFASIHVTCLLDVPNFGISMRLLIITATFIQLKYAPRRRIPFAPTSNLYFN